MISKLSCNQAPRLRRTDKRRLVLLLIVVSMMGFSIFAPAVCAADAPAWMHAAVSAPIPAHDEKTDAILLYAEDNFVVQSNGKMKQLQRRVYKILRPTGRGFGTIRVDFDATTRITFIHGWCIPAQGKDYEVKDKEAVESALPGLEDGNLASEIGRAHV